MKLEKSLENIIPGGERKTGVNDITKDESLKMNSHVGVLKHTLPQGALWEAILLG